MIGEVLLWELDRGYGFLRIPHERRNVFLHFADVEGGAHDPPRVGDLVEFDLIGNLRGPRAVEARIVKRAAPAR